MVRSVVPWGARAPRLFESSGLLGAGPLFSRFRHEMDQMMEEFFGRGDGGEHHEGFVPRANIAESDSQYEITVDLPGVKTEDVTVEWKDGDLWITGERKLEAQQEGKSCLCGECVYGAFRRIISLNQAVKEDQIHAEYKDGVLRLTVPKDEAAQPKRIKVVQA